MYELFGYPVLRDVFYTIAPILTIRYRHSDSDMGHLFARARQTRPHGVNFWI